MSFNGSGTFVINSSGQPVVANTVISSTVFNALTADLATGLSTCITKDGQTTPTANIPMGTFKFTNLGNGSAATDSATLGQVQASTTKLVTVTGTDTITGTMTPALTAYASGQMFYFIAAGANTGAVTLNIDGLGARNVTRHGSVALVAGDILSGEVCVVVYDGTRFQLLNPASYTNLNVTGTLTVGSTSTFTGLITANGGVSGALNGTVGATTPNTGAFTTLSASSTVSGTGFTNLFASPPAIGATAANTGAFTTLSASSTVSGTGFTNYFASPPPIGSTAANTGSFTTLTTSSTVTLNGGTANGVLYLNGSKVATSGSALVFDGTNLGIGTTSPVFKLVVSNAGVQGFEFDPSNGIFQVYNRSTSAYGELRPYASLMRFFTGSSPVETMRLDSSGNLGLGVTPVSASSIVKAFEFGQRGVLWATTSTTNTALSANGYLNASSAWTYKETGTATAYQQDGSHKWLIAGSGTGGTAITFTQAMTLDASGNLGIGTASPTALLDVNANTMRLRTARTPASATAAGNAGDICWDATYLYICTATNTWRRILHATW